MMRARGVAARGARPLAAATCWTRRRVARPRPAGLLPGPWGCDGGMEGSLAPWGRRGGGWCSSAAFPSLSAGVYGLDNVRKIKPSLGGLGRKDGLCRKTVLTSNSASNQLPCTLVLSRSLLFLPHFPHVYKVAAGPSG